MVWLNYNNALKPLPVRMKLIFLRASFLCSLFFSVLPLSVFAANYTNYKPLKFPVIDKTQIKINGFRGTVKIVGSNEATSLEFRVRRKDSSDKTTDSPWKFSVTNIAEVLHLQILGPPEKGDWLQGANIPEFDVLVTGPAVKTSVFWRQGRIEEKNWKSDLSVILVDGSFTGKTGTGTRKLDIKEGSVSLVGHRGEVALESFDAQISLQRNQGQLRVNNYSGKTMLTSHEGNLTLESYNGQVTIQELEGDIHFDMHRGNFRAYDFRGKMHGQTRDSEINVRFLGQSTIDLVSTTGSLAVRAPKNSGASVSVSSSEGVLDVPAHFRWTRLPDERRARGRLSGASWSRVRLKSSTGRIWVR